MPTPVYQKECNGKKQVVDHFRQCSRLTKTAMGSGAFLAPFVIPLDQTLAYSRVPVRSRRHTQWLRNLMPIRAKRQQVLVKDKTDESGGQYPALALYMSVPQVGTPNDFGGVAQHPDDSVAFVLSHFEAEDLLKLSAQAPQQDSEHVEVTQHFSVDLGRREVSGFYLTSEGIKLEQRADRGEIATWGELKKMCKKGRGGAFEVYADGVTEPTRIVSASDETGLVSSLMPSRRRCAPTLVLSGFTMHRVSKGVDPWTDTTAKLDAVRPALRGSVLDVCTGLGYTALQAAMTPGVSRVSTIERDPMVRNMMHRNPWSRPLFALVEEGHVDMLDGGAESVVRTLADRSFDIIIHDPPARVIGGALYSADFYAQLFRVAKPGAVLFHYIGDPASKESGRLFKGVMNRLRDVGFNRVAVNRDAFGVTAVKPKN